MTPRSLRMSPSWASFSHSQSPSTNSVRSEGEESLSRDTTPSIAPSWQSLSGSSSRSRRMTESSPKGKRQTKKADSIDNMQISTRTPAATHAKPKTTWSTDDSFLPRAKPPPPLKLVTNKRDRSECNKPPPDPTTSSQSSTSSNKSSPQLPELHSTQAASLSFPPSLDVSILGGHPDGPVVQHGSTRPGTRLTIASESSDDTGVSLAPSKSGSGWKWKPPTSWAGPSKAAATDEDDRPKSVGGWQFTRKKSVKSSSQDSSLQAPAGLNHAQSLNELKRSDGHVIGTRNGPLSPGVAVKIQCYQNQEWQEKPMVDVIPMLRELRIK